MNHIPAMERRGNTTRHIPAGPGWDDSDEQYGNTKQNMQRRLEGHFEVHCCICTLSNQNCFHLLGLFRNIVIVIECLFVTVCLR